MNVTESKEGQAQGNPPIRSAAITRDRHNGQESECNF